MLPAILFLDQLDVLAPNRNMSGAMEPLTNESIGQLTQECDRVPNTDSHIYLMVATNSPNQFDGEVLAWFLELTEEGRGLGSRELESWLRIAEQNALMRAVRNGGPEHYSITLEDFDTAQMI